MASATTITLFDGLATPVGHAFSPAKTAADMAMFEDRAIGVYVGYNRLTVTLTRPSGPSVDGQNRNLKLSYLLETPKLEVPGTAAASGYVSPAKVAYRPKAEIVFTFPERCTLQDRKDLRNFVANLIGSSGITADAIEKYELPY